MNNIKNEYEKIYVVGYPKSGTTWLTRLLADILDSPAGNGMGGLDEEEIASDFNLQILKRDTKPKYKILKTHLLIPHLKSLDTNLKKIVYIERDFRDVLISSFFYQRENCDEKLLEKRSILELKENNISFFKYLKNRMRLWLHIKNHKWKNTVGSWSNHIESYKNI